MANNIDVKDAAGLTVTISTIETAGVHSQGVNLTAALPAGTNNIGDVDVLSLPALPAGSNVIGGVTQSGTWNVGVTGTVTVTGTVDTELANAATLADATANPTVGGVGAFNLVWNGSTWDRLRTTALGTQGTGFIPVQQAHMTGRSEVRFYAVAAASGATGTETAITLTRSVGNSATTTGTSHTPTSGKRLRITYLSVATRGNATATAQATTFNLRINTAGAVTTTSTPIILAVRSATPATANAWDRVMVPLGDGIEIVGDGTLQWGITAAATFTTNAPTWDVTLIGYEY